MIELNTLEYLTESLDVTVYAEYPEAPTGTFVVIDLTASSIRNHIETATIAIQSYGSTKLEAAWLNEQVKMAMSEMRPLSARLTSSYYFADTRAIRHRYQSVYEITEPIGR